MSAIAANSGSRSRGLASATALRAHRVMVPAAVTIAVAGTAGSVLVATSGHLVDPVRYAIEIGLIAVGTCAVALFWMMARPGNRIAAVLLCYAAAITGVSLQGAASPLLHSVGVLFDVPAFLLTFYLVFLFPEGRVRGFPEKVLLAGAGWVILAAFLPSFFFSPFVSGAAPLAGCNASCPENALMIDDRPSLAKGFGTTEGYIAAALAAAIVVLLCYRLVTASRPRVRALLPVYVPALMLTVPFGVFQAAGAGMFSLDADTRANIGWFLTVGRTIFTFGFLLAIVQAMVFAGAALRTILTRVDRDEDPAHLRALVAEALDDPPLELAFAVAGGNPSFVSSDGAQIDPASVGDGRSATAIRSNDHTVGYIVHDPALATDPELLEAAGYSVLLALEGGRLESELRSKTDELRASRARIVAAAEQERLRLERDLHDGAQQRLMSIQVKIALAQQREETAELRAQLEEIRLDAAAAVEELRTLAHGIYPTVLLERGLADALRSLAMTAPIPIAVSDRGIGRCPGTVEAAIYFCALEAIQNAAKHGGSGAAVSVTLGRGADGIHFSIADNGVGMDAEDSTTGMGLVNMRDRIGAVAGELDIVSSPGRGTTVSGWVPSVLSEPQSSASQGEAI